MTQSTYIDYPFVSYGVNFISRVYSHSDMAEMISRLPANIFAKMNSDAVHELIGDVSLLSTEELIEELERVNEGGSHAFIMLGENN